MTAGAAAGYPTDLLELVEEYLAELDFGADRRAARLAEAMRYSLLAGGKRIRPVLTLATARGCGADPTTVLPTAAALELIHTYSLIHDDLPAIDDDTLRRGRPTCHVAFGEDVAILAGDGLFAEAFNLVLSRQSGECAAVLAALAEIAAAAGVQGMVGGQYMDVAGETAADDDLRTLHALKTGRLIQAAVVCGALLGGAADVGPHRAFAAELGLLFQIVDDILDETGAVDELGKSVGKDRALDKVTYVSRFGMRRALELADRSERRARELLGALGGDTADLAAITTFIHDRRW
ncbi:MAG TPA: polyprenyl synthetase family protein [Thermoleophilia bacterium]|nr:polyprenyl synthetase family protein [Acidobacteriota bacterium]NLT91688.1 polyprenyl synthetase family protein [Actinomycetota bacterium]HQF52909.1 polyprenyl synthetase family protein [Thermoleophilia bacterium]HQJ26918.1 polyprenyl synthetase family protein [Thermoleophilia bacterium]